MCASLKRFGMEAIAQDVTNLFMKIGLDVWAQGFPGNESSELKLKPNQKSPK